MSGHMADMEINERILYSQEVLAYWKDRHRNTRTAQGSNWC